MKNAILIIVLGVFVSGCALTVDEIHVPYEGKANLNVVDGAEKIFVTVAHADKHTVFKDRVGAKKNGYGMEMASIVPTNDIARTFAVAVKFELENLGFKIGEGGKTVRVDLIRFYNGFKMGFFAGDAVADGLINVAILDSTGTIIFSRPYKGGGVVDNIQLATGENAREALIKEISDIVGKVAHDKQLHKILSR
ncbi:MAG: YajG family lipoprotein [Rhodospirillaceae bacterium]